jgi:DNA polymerase III subunit beta
MPAFLVDALNSFTGDTVTLHTQTNPTRPVLFTDTPHGLTDGTTFRHLLMPVHPPRT